MGKEPKSFEQNQMAAHRMTIENQTEELLSHTTGATQKIFMRKVCLDLNNLLEVLAAPQFSDYQSASNGQTVREIHYFPIVNQAGRFNGAL